MKKLNLICCTLFCILTLFTSCQKEVDLELEDGTPPGTKDERILGTWKFVHSQITTEVIDEMQLDGFGNIKTITVSDYTTQNNTGTVVFDEKNMNNKDIAYDASIVAHAKIYEDDVLTDEIDFPFDVSMPSASSTASYRIQGDSIYFDGGSIMNIEGYGAARSAPSAVHYTLDNNRLILTGKVSQRKTEITSYYKQVSTSKGTTITVLEK